MGYCPAPVTQCPRRVANLREEGVEADRELMLEDASSLRDSLWRIARYAQDAAELMEDHIEDETLNGRTEAEELREALERLQDASLEVSEELDAYQQRHAR
jgi:Mg2+ and Co2+ transporter CorA